MKKGINNWMIRALEKLTEILESCEWFPGMQQM